MQYFTQLKNQKDKNTMEESIDIRKILYLKTAYSKILSKKFGSDSLTSSYAVFAEAISANCFHSQQELSDYLCCNKAHTSRTLLKMQIKGLIAPLHLKQEIILTEKGKKYAEQVKKSKEKMISELFEGISPEDSKNFAKVLNQIIKNAKVIK